MFSRALRSSSIQRSVVRPVVEALQPEPYAKRVFVSVGAAMEAKRDPSNRRANEAMEREEKRALEETRQEQSVIDQKAERLVQEGRRKADGQKPDEQKEQERDQRDKPKDRVQSKPRIQNQSGQSEPSDEQSKASMAQAIAKATEPGIGDDLVTTADETWLGYNEEEEDGVRTAEFLTLTS